MGVFRELLLDNPEMGRQLKPALRSGSFSVFQTVYLLLFLVVVFIELMGFYDGTRGLVMDREMKFSRWALIAYWTVVGFQAGYLCLVGTVKVIATVVYENVNGTLEYVRLSPVRPLAITLGKLFGAPAAEYVLLALAMPVAWFLFDNTDAPLSAFFLTQATIVLYFAAFHSSVMILAVFARRSYVAAFIFFVVTLGFTITAAILGTGFTWGSPSAVHAVFPIWPVVAAHLVQRPVALSIELFGAGCPMFAYLWILYALVVVVNVHMAARRIGDDQRPLISRPMGLVYFVLCCWLLVPACFDKNILGFFFRAFRGSGIAPDFAYAQLRALIFLLLMSLLCYAWLSLHLTPGRDAYRRYLQRQENRGGLLRFLLHDRAPVMPYMMTVALAGLVVAALAAVTYTSEWYVGERPQAVWLTAAMVALWFAFVATCSAIVQVFCLRWPRAGRVMAPALIACWLVLTLLLSLFPPILLRDPDVFPYCLAMNPVSAIVTPVITYDAIYTYRLPEVMVERYRASTIWGLAAYSAVALLAVLVAEGLRRGVARKYGRDQKRILTEDFYPVITPVVVGDAPPANRP